MSPYDLNLRHLGAAAEVGRLGSISAAAAAANMSQSALTQAVGRLEAQLDQPLFDRRRLGTVMTSAAVMFFKRTEQALAYLRDGVEAILRTQRSARVLRPEYKISMSQLRALIAVERTENYTLAASTAGFSQPTIYRAVRQIERSVGISLFLPSGKMVQATAAAKTLARSAKLATVELQAALDEIAALRYPDAGRIAIGSSPFAGAALLPNALVKLNLEFPAARVQVVEGAYHALLHDLRHGELDILLGALRSPVAAPDIMQIPLFSAPLYVVASASHRLVGVTQPSIVEMAKFPWVIAREGTPIREKWNHLFAAAGVHPPARVVECGSVVVIRELLLGDEFLTLLSTDQFQIEERSGLLARIGAPLPDARREIGITHRVGWRPTHLQARFVQALRDVAATKISSPEVSDLVMIRVEQL